MKGPEALKNGRNLASSDLIGQNGSNAAQLVAMVSKFEKTAADRIAENVSYDLAQNGLVWVENHSLFDLLFHIYLIIYYNILMKIFFLEIFLKS